ncbi:LOW QUALITY PROTEIN: hypothetical protein PanWU01x14_070750 [Parasponia andersonii]|uniref:Uncharacterized protein n=1 Tax=Parasponia andersonii TaxID=3476 RepID=A0A2P5DF20_PARAD|nr:LOW QUALITY PROTEIN: hypothetical protein PanWU01x14_070750 [Parasponia andersonii]
MSWSDMLDSTLHIDSRSYFLYPLFFDTLLAWPKVGKTTAMKPNLRRKTTLRSMFASK